MSRHYEKSSEQEDHSIADCKDCGDTGFLLEKVSRTINHQDGDITTTVDVGKPCHCQKEKNLKSRFKNALIPDEFKNARFKNYEKYDDTTTVLFDATKEYLSNFENIIKNGAEQNSLGFVAVLGESRIRAMEGEARYEAKDRHNNFGLGKTHLQIAAAKWILNNIRVRDEIAPGQYSKFDRGCRVLCVSDITFMDDLIASMFANDGDQTLNDLVNQATSVDVLVWDDLGKAKWSETKEGLYYRIINERYINNRPIIFSSNEDEGTLSEKIGYASASRLFGMCGDRLYAVEGKDYRLKRGEKIGEQYEVSNGI